MPDTPHCARCGAALAAYAVDGFCSACLLERGLDAPDARPVAPAEHVPFAASQASGTLIGRYKLLERIGEGGMGTVWMAEQVEPVRRMVALKLTKPGMVSGNVLARFELERQALALMEHPNIAKILDAGVTGGSAESEIINPKSQIHGGRPYFVMELVKGVPITKFCDDQRLSIRERLELFMPVCHAIQHAHQKGVIHRDIKPCNVLVALYDGRPVPKVIDFGIAKATGRQLTERTLFTGFGALIGTPEYMSPEQAELNQLDIDTRSDIYSLGVLLYELLTGTTPLKRETLRQADLVEVLRRIREEEPPKPSTRLTESNYQISPLSSRRKIDPTQWSKLIHGDLDWIVMKALDKDRNRRYETANGFASDIQRHLNQEPVLACPPSAAYRFQKLVRRNKLICLTGAAVVAALVMGFGTATWSFLNEREARQRARAAEERSQVRENEARASEAKAREALSVFVEGQITRKFPPRTNSLKARDAAAPASSVEALSTNSGTNQPASITNKLDAPSRNVPTGAGFETYPGGGGGSSAANPVVPPSSVSYPRWAAAWWQWGMELPWTDSAGRVHPFIDTLMFDVTQGQQGEVWFLSAPFDRVTRTCTIPPGKLLFFPVLNAESSSIEAPPFLAHEAADQAAVASYFADHIVELFCEIDGIPVPDLTAYRFANPQIAFHAPTPWIFGDLGGPGTSTGDGYYLMLRPLDPGPHTIRYGGAFRFRTPFDPFDLYAPLDMTYHLFIP